MPKQLLIVRHGKSDWNNLNLSDFDRPINQRGKKNAPEMAKRLVKKNIIPQQLVSSPALRAITTANYFAEELGMNKPSIIREPTIYEASSQTLLGIINKLDNKSDLTALFGHNPGLTDLIPDLCDTGLFNIPTCGMVLIKFPIDDWSMVSNGTGDLVFFDYPKKGEE